MTRILVALVMLVPVLGSCGSDPVDAAAIPVRIRAAGCGPVPINGSGVIADHELVLTVAHVVAGAGDIEVATRNGERYEAVIRAIDTSKDLALLEVPGLRGHRFEMADIDGGAQGTFVGYGGDDAGVVGFTVMRRVTIRINDIYDGLSGTRLGLEFEASVDPGDSGAALVDSRGRVVGMAFASSRNSSGIGYATAAGEFEHILDGVGPGAVAEPARCRS